ncbi:hypothetical protein BGW37DRAFT_489705 [Umbelopsis sp. PMI_123]|nr:hypothetical protein BGW37DRAFT_489705 [Umbelopsis sp. PMI_123]
MGSAISDLFLTEAASAAPTATDFRAAYRRQCKTAVGGECYGCSHNCDPENCLTTNNTIPRVSRSFCSQRIDRTDEPKTGVIQKDHGGISASIGRVLGGVSMILQLTLTAHHCTPHSFKEFGNKILEIIKTFKQERNLTDSAVFYILFRSFIGLFYSSAPRTLISLFKLVRTTLVKDKDERETAMVSIVRDIGRTINMHDTAEYIADSLLSQDKHTSHFDINPANINLQFSEDKFYKLLTGNLASLLSAESIEAAAEGAIPSDKNENFYYTPIKGDTLAILFHDGYRILDEVHFAARIDLVLAAMMHSSRIETKHRSLATIMIAAILGSVARANMNDDLGDIPLLCRYVCAGFQVSKQKLDPCNHQHSLSSGTEKPTTDSFWETVLRTVYALLTTFRTIVRHDSKFDQKLASALKWYNNPTTEAIPMELLESLFDSVDGHYDSDVGELKFIVKGHVKLFFDELKNDGVLRWIVKYISPNTSYKGNMLNVQIPRCWVQSWRLAALAMQRRGHMAKEFTQSQLLAPLTWPDPGKTKFPVEETQKTGTWLFNLRNSELELVCDPTYVAISYAGSEINFVQGQFERLRRYLLNRGYTYIWLDKLCWRTSKDHTSYYDMMEIYTNAAFTVVVDPYASFSGVDDTAWAERTWTRAELAVSQQVKLWIGNSSGTGDLVAYKYDQNILKSIPDVMDWFMNSISLTTEDSVLAFGAVAGALKEDTVALSVCNSLTTMSIDKVLLYPPSCRKELSWLPAIGGASEKIGDTPLAKIYKKKNSSIKIEARVISLRFITLERKHWMSGRHDERHQEMKNGLVLEVAKSSSKSICWITVKVEKPRNAHRVIGCAILEENEFMRLKKPINVELV